MYLGQWSFYVFCKQLCAMMKEKQKNEFNTQFICLDCAFKWIYFCGERTAFCKWYVPCVWKIEFSAYVVLLMLMFRYYVQEFRNSKNQKRTNYLRFSKKRWLITTPTPIPMFSVGFSFALYLLLSAPISIGCHSNPDKPTWTVGLTLRYNKQEKQ